jgi:hypothetical protein
MILGPLDRWEHLEIAKGLSQEGRRTGVGENGGLYFFRMDSGELNQVMNVHGPEVGGSVLCKVIPVDERRYSDSGSRARNPPGYVPIESWPSCSRSRGKRPSEPGS